MNALAVTIFDRAQGSLGDALPRLGGALLILLIGLPIAILLGRVVRKMLSTAGLDSLGDRTGVHDGLTRLGFEPSLSKLVARAVRIALFVLVIVAAISLLGFATLSIALNELVLFVPRLFVAVAIVIAGFVAAEFLRGRTDRLTDQMALGIQGGQLVEIVVIALFVLTALSLLGIPTQILVGLVALVIAAGVLSLALAFGLGGREVAREISAGRSVQGIFRIGERISVGDVTGEITAIEPTSTIVLDADGTRVRVPNHLLVESVVRVHDSDSGAAS